MSKVAVSRLMRVRMFGVARVSKVAVAWLGRVRMVGVVRMSMVVVVRLRGEKSCGC